MTTLDEKRSRLERRANVVRSRLLRAVDALDARRHQVVEVAETARKVAVPAAAAVLGIVGLFGMSALAFGIAMKRRRRDSFSYRLAEAVREMELVPRPSIASRVLEKTLTTVASLAATELARRALQNAFDGRLLDGRLAVGHALDAHHRAVNALPATPPPKALPGV